MSKISFIKRERVEKITLKQLLDDWIENDLKPGSLSNGTIELYQNIAKLIKRHPLSEQRINTITSEQLQNFMDIGIAKRKCLSGCNTITGHSENSHKHHRNQCFINLHTFIPFGFLEPPSVNKYEINSQKNGVKLGRIPKRCSSVQIMFIIIDAYL